MIVSHMIWGSKWNDCLENCFQFLRSHCCLTYLRFVFAPRLDLVPINRSVGLKAKPTKPVTEVLRPVVAKYGLNLGDLVAKIVSCPHSGYNAFMSFRLLSSVRLRGWSIMARGGRRPHPFSISTRWLQL